MFGFINNSQSRYLYQFFGSPSTTDPAGTVLSTNWVTWSKPNDMSFFWFYAVGGGGGGGAGVNGVASVTTRNGGGGGHAGAIRTLLLPAYLVPDTLYISLGKGGLGVSNANGTNGSATIVAVQPPSTGSNPPYFLFASGGTAGRNSGLTGVFIAEPTITATETIKYLGYSSGLAPSQGVSGGAGGANSATWSPLPSQPIGGTGGGGANATVAGYGGSAPIGNTAFNYTVPGGIPGATGGGTGANVVKNQYGFIFYPATGGAANVASAASPGGRGFAGCGGGGGGGGAGSGIGGDGGDGFVIIGGW
jgi:hypothetical protein